jgi:hypothetical protein
MPHKSTAQIFRAKVTAGPPARTVQRCHDALERFWDAAKLPTRIDLSQGNAGFLRVNLSLACFTHVLSQFVVERGPIGQMMHAGYSRWMTGECIACKHTSCLLHVAGTF